MNLLENALPLGSLSFLAGLALGVALWALRARKAHALQASLEQARVELETQRRETRLRANEENLTLRQQAEAAVARQRQELAEAEARLIEREKLINRQLENLVLDQKNLRAQQLELETVAAGLAQERQRLIELAQEEQKRLEAIAHLSEADARTMLLQNIEKATQAEAASMSRHILEEAKTHAEEKARAVLSVAIQRYAGEHTFESTSATITLPNDEIKGRIIGREGRNIRAFEAATGVTVLIDDTPNAVVLSGFDPVRREIARESMQRLILDGRIHPTRIEEVVAKVTQEMDDQIVRAGQEALQRTGLPPLHEEIVKLLGRLKFRHSFSQNVLAHSIEVAHLMGLIAAELGLDIPTAKRVGLLHDIGKALDQELPGAHAVVGADFIKRFGESAPVVNGVASHHNDVPAQGPWGPLVSAADAISASRPGARSETMTTYLQRVTDLERIATSFPGVEKAFAVQAGRELRVFVQPEIVNDDEALALAHSITRQIEDTLQYPGQIRVTVLRETRCVEFAK